MSFNFLFPCTAAQFTTSPPPEFQPDGFIHFPQITKSTPEVASYLREFATEPDLVDPFICKNTNSKSYLWIILEKYREFCPETAICILKTAARHGHLDIMRILIRNFKVEAWTEDNVALRLAVKHRNTEMVEFLLSNPKVDAISCDNEAIKTAITNGSYDIVKQLIQYPVDLTGVLEWAATHDYADIVRVILTKQDPSANDNYAIRLAAICGSINTVNILLNDSRVDAAACDHYAIIHATIRGHINVLTLLCKTTPQPVCVRALKIASKYHQANSVEFWLNHLGPGAGYRMYNLFANRLMPQVDKLWRTHLDALSSI